MWCLKVLKIRCYLSYQRSNKPEKTIQRNICFLISKYFVCSLNCGCMSLPESFSNIQSFESFVYPGGNCPGGKCPIGNCPGVNVPVGIFLGEKYQGGSCPGGNCPLVNASCACFKEIIAVIPMFFYAEIFMIFQ